MNKVKQFPLKKEQTVSIGNLYDLNKQIMKQTAKPLTHLELATIQPKLEDWFNWRLDGYAMLLCHERRDYTVFHLYEKENPNPPAVAASECIGCLTDRGEVLSIDLNKDKVWEIWVKINEEPYCYYLFPYDDAVIEV